VKKLLNLFSFVFAKSILYISFVQLQNKDSQEKNEVNLIV